MLIVLRNTRMVMCLGPCTIDWTHDSCLGISAAVVTLNSIRRRTYDSEHPESPNNDSLRTQRTEAFDLWHLLLVSS